MDIFEKTFNVVKKLDLEDYILDLYGLETDLISTKARTHSIDGVLSKWDLQLIDDVHNNVNRYGACHAMLQKLCADGWLPAGEYMVEEY